MNKVLPVLAALTVTSLSAPAAWADGGSPAPSTPSTPAYSGYSSSGVAVPLKVEVFEPTIPLPTTPQGEFDLGYAKIKANSAGTQGRASFLWPGDAVGEGLKTFFDQLGLPDQAVQNGYPVQVNSQYPSSTTTQSNTPLPGTSMTTTSDKGKAQATVGFSTNCDAGDGGAAAASGSAPSGSPSASPSPGLLPSLPPLPDTPVTGNLDDILGLLGLSARAAATSRSDSRDPSSAPSPSGSASPPPDAAQTCQLPAALAPLVDVNGYVADSKSLSDGSTVTATSRTALGDVRLLGGIVTLSGIDSSVASVSNGKTGQSQGRADYGTMTIAGQTFGIGPEGYVAQGQPGAIPGLPDDPTAALAALGITVQLPKPVYKADGDKASGTVEGLIVTIDTKTLKPALSQIQLGPLLDQVPFPSQAAPLKSLLGALGNLSPRIVLHLGYTTSGVDTVQGIAIPATVPDNDPSSSPSAQPTGGSASGGATGGGGAAGAAGGGSPAVSGGGPSTTGLGGAGAAPTTTAALAPASSPGLPPLFSIPGLLLCAGLGGALLAGGYVRKIGALVLGAGGPCSHGLASGLPDLRKVQ